jgi:hypothetical protein
MRGLSKGNQLLNSDFRDILSAFCEEKKVEFTLVGAYAVAAHGLPRAPGDIDLGVKSSEKNAERVWAALSRFGAPLGNVSRRDFITQGNVVQIGVTPRRIDTLTQITGVAYEDAATQTITIELIGLAHLLRNKSAVGRPQDKADVARLQELSNK